MRKNQDKRGIAAAARGAAFTLVELLVVMAISIILLALLFGPIVQSFNFTRKARAVSQAQDAARFGLQRLTRELSQATYVFDNTSAPIIFPLEQPDQNLERLAAYGNRGLSYPGNTSEPAVLFSRIDFIPAASRQITPGSGEVMDPTTGGPVGGSDLRFPLSPGKRVVRYFVGLRFPYQLQNGQIVENGGVPVRRWYSNVYEFPRSDNNMNPFILYRAEFNPNDPSLFNQELQDFNNAQRNQAGFNDPNFFYNITEQATSLSKEKKWNPNTRQWENWTGNGRTYGENWYRIAEPVMASANMDLLAWRKDATRSYDRANPFQSTVRFAPTTVIGDTATPGFLSNAGSEAPGAAPTVYAAKHGQWVTPYTVTFYRGATRNNPDAGNTGSLALTVSMLDQRDGTRLPVAQVRSAGRLGVGDDVNWYYTFSPTTGKLLVKTPALTFQVDPNKGRIETALPPLAGNTAGAPMYREGSALQPMGNASLGPNFVDPVPTIFRLNTRHPNVGADTTLPTNQGIIEADLYRLNGQNGDYFPTDTPTPEMLPSPMHIFGQPLNPTTYVGIHIVPGSEQVFAPDITFPEQSLSNGAAVGHANLVAYSRLPFATGGLGSNAVTPIRDKDDASRTMYPTYGTGPLNYLFDTILSPNQAILQFGNAGLNEVGLPARRINDTNAPEKELRVTYLWQNNFARNANGEPVNADNQTYQQLLMQTEEGTNRSDVRFQPEADVVKVDYSTRSLITIALGARVYDTSSGRPTAVQVTDKVEVNNVGR